MEIYLESYHKPQDGNDWSPALSRAIKAFKPTASGTSNTRGFTVRFKPKEYYFSKSIHLNIPLHLLGSGTAPHSGTVLKFPKGEKGIIVHHQNTDKYEKYGKGAPKTGGLGAGSIIEKLTIAAGKPTAMATPSPMLDFEESGVHPHSGAHGVTLYSIAVLRDVFISNFDGHGIYVYGVTMSDIFHPDVITVADFWQLTNVRVERCGGDGLHLYGSDAHNGVAIGCQFLSNIGWGICDFSQLGSNTFLSGQAAYNITGGVYRPSAVSNRSYGTLAPMLRYELSRIQNPAPNILKYYQTIFDQLATFRKDWELPDVQAFPGLLNGEYDTRTFWQIYRKYTDAVAVKRKSVGEKLYAALLKVGFDPQKDDFGGYGKTALDFSVPYTTVGASVFLSFYSENNGIDVPQRNEVGVVNFCFNSPGVQSSSQSSGLDLSGHQNTFRNIVHASDGLMLNGGNLLRSASEPPTDVVPHGTIILNKNPSNGGNIGWVFTSNNQWKAFGKIEI